MIDDASASVIHNATDLSKWSVEAIRETDRLIAIAQTRPLSQHDELALLRIHRELLVRLTQRDTLNAWAVEVWQAHLAAMTPPPPAPRASWMTWLRAQMWGKWIDRK